MVLKWTGRTPSNPLYPWPSEMLLSNAQVMGDIALFRCALLAKVRWNNIRNIRNITKNNLNNHNQTAFRRAAEGSFEPLKVGE
jgi:hypothetical protein